MSDKGEHCYDDIINLPHHVSTKHPHMAPLDRAAQFSPFAALTGHEAAIKETERLTEDRLELDEDKKELLDGQFQVIREHLAERPEITFTYFKPDEKKSGGSYVTTTGNVKKMDLYTRRIMFEDGTWILMDDVVAVEGELVKELGICGNI